MFRHPPTELFFREAKRRRVGIPARVPLASGLLTCRMARQTVFSADGHRSFNRHGEPFDRGETFSGVDFEAGLEAVDELKNCLPADTKIAQLALRRILMLDAVARAIPGAKHPSQVEENIRAADVPPVVMYR